MSENKSTSLTDLQGGSLDLQRKQAPMSLTTGLGFEQLVRVAKVLNQSTMVPAQYRQFVEKKQGQQVQCVENPNGLANCVVALNMAVRMNADPLQIMQNLYVIEGRPSWSSTFIIASINHCGRFSPLRFELSEPGEPCDVEYNAVEWVDKPGGGRQRKDVKRKTNVRHQTCRAWVIEKETGERLDGPTVSIQMAIDEGWLTKNGSKWQTMPEVMLRYRAASLFGRLYAPELLMGLQSQEEAEDIAISQAREVQGDRVRAVDLEELSRHEAKPPTVSEEEKDDVTVIDEHNQSDDTAQQQDADEDEPHADEPEAEVEPDAADDMFKNME